MYSQTSDLVVFIIFFLSFLLSFVFSLALSSFDETDIKNLHFFVVHLTINSFLFPLKFRQRSDRIERALLSGIYKIITEISTHSLFPQLSFNKKKNFKKVDNCYS